MVTLIGITDIVDKPMRSFDFGELRFDEVSISLPFRVWNNRDGLKVGISTAKNIRLDLISQPLPQNRAIEGRDHIKVKCTYSGKNQSSVNMEFQPFPISDDFFDELPSGTYNQYTVRVDSRVPVWRDEHKYVVEDLLAELWIIVEFT